MTDGTREGGFALYVHWPFCAAKCPYCDFNSHVSARIDQRAWAEAYVLSIARAAEETPGRVLRSIFLGGGTPSLMEPGVVAAVIDAAAAAWPLANDLEITLEANPGSVEADRFRAYAAAGVNRVSLGVQALTDVDLRRLGRLHSAEEALAAVRIARDVFARVSADLIYARQDQGLGAWERELRQALSLGLDHLSLYQLTIEEGTPFAARLKAGGLRGLPSEDLGADMFELTRGIAADAGLPAYEVSNHARPGAECRHNLVYWQSGDWVGVGPGAHGRLTLGGTRWATWAERDPAGWLRRVAEGRGEDREPLTQDQVLSEFVLMGLRLSTGISRHRLRALGGAAATEDNIAGLVADGWLTEDGDRLSVTEAGVPLLNRICAEVLREPAGSTGGDTA